jgi:hypothetical protein
MPRPYLNLKPHQELRSLFIVILAIHVLTFALSYIFYNGSIDIVKEAFSDCGAVNTRYGHPNMISFIIFSSGMMVCGFISALISRVFWKWRGLKYRKNMMWSMRSASVGYVILMIPNDIFEVIHCIGMILVLSSLWYMIGILLRELKGKIGMIWFWSSHIILGASIISYFFECIITWGSSSYTQKVAILGLALIFFLNLNKLYSSRRTIGS